MHDVPVAFGHPRAAQTSSQDILGIEALSDRFEELSKRAATVAAEKSLLETRRTALEDEVGVLKGKLALKPQVDRFLEDLQAEAHERRVGSFERLLTALVRDVLPDENPIGLDLSIERGQPSLDIVSRRRGGSDEDVYHDQGGALTNIVSAGLRIIAAVRSGTRRFLVIDEGDCWIKPSRVPAFMKVLSDVSSKVGVQCLVISHHGIENFRELVSAARLSGDKDAGVRIENDPRLPKWVGDEDAISFVRLRDFQSYRDETLRLSPGVTALFGDNNLGKSVFVRAFRAVFYGDCRDSLIRHGSKACSVEIGLADGRVLKWDRRLGRNPKNVWKLLAADGSVVERDGVVCETGGRAPPSWVAEIFGIGEVAGLSVHVVTQKEPVFLLDENGPTRASVLSIGQEGDHIRTMLAKWKEEAAADGATVRAGEKEMNAIVVRLRELDDTVPSLTERVDTLRAVRLRIADERVFLAEAGRLLDRRSGADRAQQAVAARLDILRSLPSQGEVSRLQDDVGTDLTAQRCLAVYDRGCTALRRGSAAAKAVDDTPAVAPSLLPIGRAAAACSRRDGASDRYTRSTKALDALVRLPGSAPATHSTGVELRLLEIVDQGAGSVRAARDRVAAVEGFAKAPPVVTTSESIMQAMSTRRSSDERRLKAERRLHALEVAPVKTPPLPPPGGEERALTILGEARLRLERALASTSALRDLPQAPGISPDGGAGAAETRLARALAALAAANTAEEDAGRRLVAAEIELEEIVEAAGGACPTCGGAFGGRAGGCGHDGVR